MYFEEYVSKANEAARTNVCIAVLESGTESDELHEKLNDTIFFAECEDKSNQDFYNAWQDLKQGFKQGQPPEALGIRFSDYLMSQGWSL